MDKEFRKWMLIHAFIIIGIIIVLNISVMYYSPEEIVAESEVINEDEETLEVFEEPSISPYHFLFNGL